MRGKGFTDLVRLAAPLVQTPGVRNVAGAVHRFQVETWRAAHSGFEALCVPDRPRRHVAPVAIAPDAGSIAIRKRPLQGSVEDGHQVEVILTTPVAANHVGE